MVLEQKEKLSAKDRARVGKSGVGCGRLAKGEEISVSYMLKGLRNKIRINYIEQIQVHFPELNFNFKFDRVRGGNKHAGRA